MGPAGRQGEAGEGGAAARGQVREDLHDGRRSQVLDQDQEVRQVRRRTRRTG